MNKSRFCAAIVATLALFAADHASAQEATGTTVVLNTYSKVWITGDALGPVQNGTPRIGKNTGAGIMDANFTWDQAGYKTNSSEVLLGTVYTRSATQPNNNNSYMQGGFALAKLTTSGIVYNTPVDLPVLNGERAFMRPLIGFTTKYAVLIAASEDNGVNNNPQPVMFIADKTTGQLVKIPNSTRQNNNQVNINKPTNLIQQALRDGIDVDNPDNQRGPHSIVPVTDNSFVVGMQYNNQAAEAFRVTVNDDGTVTMNWLERYSNTAQHCRPQVAIAPAATEGFITEVEANNQPAEIGFRLTKFNVATGDKIASKIVVKSDPKNNKYVAEPAIGILGDKLAITWTLGAQARQRDGDNGHAGGSPVAHLGLFNQSDLTMIGTPLVNASQFSRHVHMFTTNYGPDAEPAIAVISGSSTGTGKGFEQVVPLKADGTLGLKDPAKVYTVAQFADVANVQARGKRNPNNQAKGFINGLGSVPNPGYDKGNTAFMPEVKSFSFSTITGYTDATAAGVGKRNSLWLSLVPASWKDGLQTTPGTPTDKPGTNPDGTGPAPRTNATPTNPSGDAQGDDGNALGGTEGTNPTGSRAALGEDNGGCAVSTTQRSAAGSSLMIFAIAGIAVALRRRNREA